MGVRLEGMFEEICSFENLLKAYYLAQIGNRYKEAAVQFNFYLEGNLLKIRQELLNGSFVTHPYKHFLVTEPKLRQISAPDFRDRVVQHALVSMIEPIFDKTFIADDYACRKYKGTHYALGRIKKFLQASRSYYGKDKEIYILKCDIKKFFPSISWDVLLTIVKKKIACQKTFDLIRKIVTTHRVCGELEIRRDCGQFSLFEEVSKEEPVSVTQRRGLPIGNLTSQLLANVYLNELDQYVKHVLREKWYGRYMDDFLIISADKEHLKIVKEQINQFVIQTLKMTLHPKKSYIQKTKDGVCFVGYRIFWDHILIRGSTLLRFQKKYRKKIRLFKNGLLPLEKLIICQQSFCGHLKHANAYKLKKRLFGDEFLK
jgi:retron-type reverse transcriptase